MGGKRKHKSAWWSWEGKGPFPPPPSQIHLSARFARQYVSYLTPIFAFFPHYQDLHVLERSREYWSVGSNRSDGKVLICGVDVKKGVTPISFSIERVWGPKKGISEHFERTGKQLLYNHENTTEHLEMFYIYVFAFN